MFCTYYNSLQLIKIVTAKIDCRQIDKFHFAVFLKRLNPLARVGVNLVGSLGAKRTLATQRRNSAKE